MRLKLPGLMYPSDINDMHPDIQRDRTGTNTMEQKTARLTILIDPTKKDAFEQLCASQDVTPSQVVRQLIREYLEKHGITYANQTQHSSSAKN